MENAGEGRQRQGDLELTFRTMLTNGALLNPDALAHSRRASAARWQDALFEQTTRAFAARD